MVLVWVTPTYNVKSVPSYFKSCNHITNSGHKPIVIIKTGILQFGSRSDHIFSSVDASFSLGELECPVVL